MDGIGRCIKNTVYRAVMAEENIIHAPADFTKIAQKLIKGIKGVFARKNVYD